jgi:hypothetical protein
MIPIEPDDTTARLGLDVPHRRARPRPGGDDVALLTRCSEHRGDQAASITLSPYSAPVAR